MNLKSFSVRALVALIFAPLIVLTVYLGQWYFFILIAILAAVSIWEFIRLGTHKESHGQLYISVLFGLAILSVLYFDPGILMPVLLAGMVVLLLVELYRNNGSPVHNVGATLFPALFFSLFLGSFLLIRELPRHISVSYAEPGQWIILLILATWICDTAAYVLGSYFGRHKLMPRISPNKSVEGAVAGFVFAILTAWLVHLWLVDELALIDSLVIGAIAGSIGQYGDLVESMFKRDAGVKDSSNLIPGHGGMMDRFDSLTLSAPVMFLYLQYIAF